MLKIKKYQWGGFTSPAFTLTYNQGTDLYNQLQQYGNFSNIGNLFSSNILQNNNLDGFGQKLQYNMTTKSTLDNIEKMSSGDSVIGNSSTGGKSNINLNKGLQTVGMLGSATYDQIPTADEIHNNNDEFASNTRSTINKTLLSSGNPYMMAAGAINTIIDKTGGFTDASQGLGKGTDFANKVASIALPGAGWFTKKTMKYNVSDTLKQNESSYGGSLSKALTAEQNAGAKILFGKNKANNKIAWAKYEDDKINDITNTANEIFTTSNNPLISLGTQLQQNGGYQQNGVRVGKSGLKMDREFAKRVVKLSKGKKENKIPGFKNGGPVNVIPDGALHKNKHHLENVDEKFEEVTAKGIPVITESAGGDITQHAEVEREEIIFNLDVTKRLEKLMEDGSDEAAIEAGKLLVHEILENTVDNTGLLNKIE